MANPQVHARSSVRKFGGHWNDYIALHSFLDSSKLHWAKAQHRALLHHDVGMEMAKYIFGFDSGDIEPVLGSVQVPLRGKPTVKEVVEQHFAEDFSKYVPTVEQWWESADATKVPQVVQTLTIEQHCEHSVKIFGGEVEDYRKLHEFIDYIETQIPQAWGITHSTFGLGLCEQVLGWVVGPREVPTRTVAEKHILAQYGCIPSAQDWLQHLPIKPFMYNQAIELSRILEEEPVAV